MHGADLRPDGMARVPAGSGVTERRKLLDLFCGAGGAGKGYMDSGWDVTGVDDVPQPNYPGTFVEDDALAYVKAFGDEYDAIHASPPCQAGCTLTSGTNFGREYPQLIPATRAALSLTGKPWIIENVAGAPIRKDLRLCGEMFGLAVIRHRYFEMDGTSIPEPEHVPHRGRVAGMRHGVWYEGPYVAVYGEGGGKGSVAQWQVAMGMDWTDVRREIAEAIPPAYTRHIGRHLLRGLGSLGRAGQTKTRPAIGDLSLPHGAGSSLWQPVERMYLRLAGLQTSRKPGSSHRPSQGRIHAGRMTRAGTA